ncbi:MAG: hypothetical protein WBA25_19605 [Jannaschia sp.]
MNTKTKDRPASAPMAETARVLDDTPTLDVSALLGTGGAKAGSARPAMTPPGEADIVAAETGIAAWHNGKKVTATWSNASPRNLFAAVEGQGWKRISNANDSSFLALSMLAAHAEAGDRTSNVEIGTDQEIHQIYVF